ncbi:MAG: hypothetical protein KC656_20185 [Myxococcales bacterium]|nr:hypothetical protein [Myxococcales bacterium]
MFALLLACSSAPRVVCTDADTPIAEGLACGDAMEATRYLRQLTGLPLPGVDAAEAVLAAHTADPDAARVWLDGIRARAAILGAATGQEAGALRSHEVWAFTQGRAAVRSDDPVGNLAASLVSVRITDDAEELALTETDIEGWITFASLAHEVRGKGPITVSIADRAAVYEMAVERFRQGDRAEKVALVSLGAFWPEVVRRWKAAPYAQQQRFIQAAVLPEAAATTSLAWVEAVLESDLVTNVDALHGALGPLALEAR